jgi:anti-sigma B factor antagonist
LHFRIAPVLTGDFCFYGVIFLMMEISLSLVGDVPVFHLCGRLDASTAPGLQERFSLVLAEGETRVVMDCRDLTYISSAGLRVFITALKSLKSRGGGLGVASLQRPVMDLFRLAGLEELFLPAASVEEAAARFR